MPKVNTDNSVLSKRSGFSSVPGQNNSTISGRAGFSCSDSSRLPQQTLAAAASIRFSSAVLSKACRKSSNSPAWRSTHVSSASASSAENSDIFSDRSGRL